MRNARRWGIATIAGIVLWGGWQAAAVADERHPFSVHDLLAMHRVAGPVASPDGSQIAFTVSAVDLEANRLRANIWLVHADGTGLRRLTNHTASSRSPAWSSDGRHVYFSSARSGSNQVWRIPIDGGEAEQVTDYPLDVGDFVLSPSGTHAAVALEVFPGTTPAETRKRLDEEAKRKSSGRIYDRLFIRHWDTWKDGRRSHVFVQALHDGKAAGDPIDVMKDMDADCPSKPFGGREEFTFTPNGSAVVFTARDAGREEAWSTNLDLFTAPIDASAAPRCLTAYNKATDTHPVFSPDGKTLAYLAMGRAGYESDRYRIMLMPWPDGKPTPLTESWDRSAGTLVWSADGNEIYTAADNLGQHSLFSIHAKTGKINTLVEKGYVTAVAPLADRVAFGMSSLKGPVELHTVGRDGWEVRQITRINEQQLAAVKLGEPEQFTFKGHNDETVYCYVVKPVDFDPTKMYPVAFLIHGGPQGSFGNNFHYRWNPQVYAGRGYAAVMVDFHGSTGYGQAFTDSIRGDWGGKPLEDLQKGLAAALERYPWMDGDRVAALGASFGGYMINWIAGKWPDRFRCLVNHDGNLDERMAYFDTEELWFPEWDHMGVPWLNPENYARHNPIDHVGQWRTPMLVIHGALDFRVVETQGMATFTALQRRGIPSRFLYFPDENHWVLKPHNSILWHETVLDWLDQWTR